MGVLVEGQRGSAQVVSRGLTRSDPSFKKIICCSTEYGLQRARVDVGSDMGGCGDPSDLASPGGRCALFSAAEFLSSPRAGIDCYQSGYNCLRLGYH